MSVSDTMLEIKEFKMQYTGPKCGAIGGGSDNAHYFRHVCPTYEFMLPSNNGKIYPPYLRLGELKEVKPEPKAMQHEWVWVGPNMEGDLYETGFHTESEMKKYLNFIRVESTKRERVK